MKFIDGIPRKQAVIFEGCLDNAIEVINKRDLAHIKTNIQRYLKDY